MGRINLKKGHNTFRSNETIISKRGEKFIVFKGVNLSIDVYTIESKSDYFYLYSYKVIHQYNNYQYHNAYSVYNRSSIYERFNKIENKKIAINFLIESSESFSFSLKYNSIGQKNIQVLNFNHTIQVISSKREILIDFY